MKLSGTPERLELIPEGEDERDLLQAALNVRRESLEIDTLHTDEWGRVWLGAGQPPVDANPVS